MAHSFGADEGEEGDRARGCRMAQALARGSGPGSHTHREAAGSEESWFREARARGGSATAMGRVSILAHLRSLF